VNLRRGLLALLTLLGTGCSTPDAGALVTPEIPSDKAFGYVAEYMVHRCGTLDCHGSAYRNLRVYGDEGLRFVSTDRPCVPPQTTGTEIAEDYASIVGLEPEAMNAVVSEHGSDPQRLSLIAKPLGIEEHMGGKLFAQGDDGYTCMTSWLAGSTDTAACLRALPTPPATLCGLPASMSFDAGAD
jgi:hypothetical protein